MTHDASHYKPDADITEQQHRSMPKPNRVDLCIRAGVTSCPDHTCILFEHGCPIAQSKPVPNATPT